VSGKINGVTSSQPATAASGNAGQRAAATATSVPSTNTASATDSVKITDTASYLVTAEQALNDVPVINSNRLAQIGASLSAGTYKVSPERIANQLLQFERLLPEERAE
jgi:negative regulator of flagellin synthesis FlgM